MMSKSSSGKYSSVVTRTFSATYTEPPAPISSYFPSEVVEVDPKYEGEVEKVKKFLKDECLMADNKVHNEVAWFYSRMGLDEQYFKSTPEDVVARHILTLYAAKVVATACGSRLKLDLHYERDHSAFFGVDSLPDRITPAVVALEYRIEKDYLGEGYDKTVGEKRQYRCQVFRTLRPICQASGTHIRLFFLSRPVFAEPNPDPSETSIYKLADKSFLEHTSVETHKYFEELLKEAKSRLGPTIKVKPSPQEPHITRVIIAYATGSVHSFFSGLTDLYTHHGFQSHKKYVEQFSNGITTIKLYLCPIDKGLIGTPALTEEISRTLEDISLAYVLPRTSLTPLFHTGVLTAAEVAYAYAAWKFSYYFMNYNNLFPPLLADGSSSEASIRDAIEENPTLVQLLYEDFHVHHHMVDQNTKPPHPKSDNASALRSIISKTAATALHIQIFNTFLLFNRHILKTNFFKDHKVALAFRLDASFLSKEHYPLTPHAIFFIVAAEFRGFHIRFRDVARGGIRIIQSRNAEAWARNLKTLFNENYNLAHTQERKNKDIPEGGSKGTILLSPEHQDKAEVAFRKYVDGILDVILPSEGVSDHFGKPELLFFGPDEGTADFMDWAALHAKSRGASFWKAFTTGKSQRLGGIPHDLFGMTTRSIHQYVLGIYEKVGLKEEHVLKFQTGGPDGDLGSNEIKISKDITTAVVDGSGVLYDPNGINREELTRLANHRKTVISFDRTKIGKNGFLVDITQKDIKLPDGTEIDSGLIFRNNFHLLPLAAADIFVPCGGRPEAINKTNVNLLFDPETKAPRWKYIVEGANLFFTQEARLELEAAGVLVFKDASANKGGVTSSSLEVLSALALTDPEFEENMTVKNGVTPAFYNEYVMDVQRIIEKNARAEFNAMWKEHEKSGKPLSVLSDVLSNQINDLSTSIMNSTLWQNIELRKRVISVAIPKNLLGLLGIDTIIQRVPLIYIQAIFGSALASGYIYECGMNAPIFSFYEYVQKLSNPATNSA